MALTKILHNLKHGFTLALMFASGVIGVAHADPAATALPTGAQVVSGDASIASTGATLNVNQTSQRAIVNWDSFHVGKDATVNFNQPNSSASTLNKINGANPSQIFGKINAPGEVILQNTAGVYFSPSASLDVGSLTATSHTISNDDYNSGKYHFDRNGSTGAVVNEGTIKAGLKGYVALLAPEVRNGGVIVAQLGTVAMASGERVTLNFDTSSHLASITTTAATINTLIENKSAVNVNGGQIILSAKALNALVSGVIKQSGTLDASNLGTKFASVGGRIVIDGDHVTLAAGSQTLAKGSAAGGSVAITATKTLVTEATSVVNVSSVDAGQGGAIKTTAPTTQLAGAMIANGGALSGKGGSVQTNAQTLVVAPTATVNTNSQDGVSAKGTWTINMPSISVDSNMAKVISATLSRSHVALNAITSTFNLSKDTVIEKVAGDSANLDITAQTDINISGEITSDTTTPLNVTLVGGQSIVLDTFASVKAANIAMNAPTISAGGDLYAFGNSDDGSSLFLALVGARLSVTGNLRSRQNQNNTGRILLSGSDEVAISATATINMSDDNGGLVDVISDNGNITIAGSILTNGENGRGGSINLLANQSIAISSTSLFANGTTDGGTVKIISNSDDVNAQNSIIQTNGGSGLGGTILISGLNNSRISSTTIQANGFTNGGTIKIGNDATNQTLPFSNFTNIDSASVLNANQLDPNAPTQNAGFIETSGHTLNISDGVVISTSGANHSSGTWLLDPYDFYVAASGGNITGAALTAALASNSVTITVTATTPYVTCTNASCATSTGSGTGSIYVNDAVNWSANTLTLSSGYKIYVGTSTETGSLNVTGNGSLTLIPSNGMSGGTANGSVLMGMASSPTGGPSGNGFNGSINISSTGAIKFGTTTYTVINSEAAFIAITGSNNYVLGTDLTFTTNYTASAVNSTFSGNLNGFGHKISGLSIANSTSNLDTGLFKALSGSGTSSVRNLGLNGSISTTNTGANTGSLVGYLYTYIVENVYTTVNVSAPNNSDNKGVGGLIGWVDYGGSTITNVYSTGNVNARNGAGGLIGNVGGGNISYAYATGAVTASAYTSGNAAIGGLIGRAGNSSISYSYATGTVTANNSGTNVIGGLIGKLDGSGGGSLTYSYATGSVINIGSGNTGGLVGDSANWALISYTYATGNVTASTASGNVGGLLGGIYCNSCGPAVLSYSYASNTVTGPVLAASSATGGLVGVIGVGPNMSAAENGNTFTSLYWNSSLNTIAAGVGAKYSSTSAAYASYSGSSVTAISTANLGTATNLTGFTFNSSKWGYNGAIRSTPVLCSVQACTSYTTSVVTNTFSGVTGTFLNNSGWSLGFAPTAANISTYSISAIAISSGVVSYDISSISSFSLPISIASGASISFVNSGASSSSALVSSIISGAGSLNTASGFTGTVTLSGSNSYTGTTIISGGTLLVSTLANGGSNSNIGASTNVASNLVLDGGTLKYIGAAVGTDRLFTLTNNGGTVDASGTGALTFTSAGSIAYTGTSTRTLTLTGTSTYANTLSQLLADNTGATSLTKSGTGTWTMSGTKTFTGVTTISTGTLKAASATALGNGAVSIDSSGTLDLTYAGTVALGSTLSMTTGAAITNSVNTSSLSVAGTSTLNGNINTVGNQTYTGAVTLGDNTSLTTLNNGSVNTNGTITFSSTVDSTAGSYYGLSVTNGTGTAALGGIVGSSSGTSALGYLCINASACNASTVGTYSGTGSGTTTLAGNVTTSGNQTYAGALTLGAHSVLTSTANSGNGAVTIAGAVNTKADLITGTIKFLGLGLYSVSTDGGATWNSYTANGSSSGGSGLNITYTGVTGSTNFVSNTVGVAGVSNYTFNPNSTTTYSYLLVGGGGGASSYGGGGGGGGGILNGSVTFAAGSQTITVGNGGLSSNSFSTGNLQKGGASGIAGANLSALGGGAGGAGNGIGGTGGSGGGGGSQGQVNAGGSGTTGQGSSGGASGTTGSIGSSGTGVSGGGGGYGSSGRGGDGGAGASILIPGTSSYSTFGGGGAGGSGAANNPASGGTGGGGTNATSGCNGNACSSSSVVPLMSGTANTGGGGAGSGYGYAGNGGSGIAVVYGVLNNTSNAYALTINSGTGKASVGGGVSNITTLTINSTSALSAVSGAIGGATLVSYNTATGYTDSSGAAGVLNLSGANTYTGGTTVTGGTLQAGSTTAFGASVSAITLNTGAALDLNGKTLANTNALTLNGTGISSGGALTNSSATGGTYAGAVTLGSDAIIGSTTGAITVSGAIASSGSAYGLALVGNQAVTLSSATNTLSTIASGSGLGPLSITNNQALTIGSMTIDATTYSGLSSTGTILVKTITGNLTVNNAITTTSTSSSTSTPAIKLSAGFSDATTSTTNNIILGSSSSSLINAGTGAIIALYSGAPLSSTNLSAFIAGQTTYFATYGVTTTTGSPASGAGYYAFYRGTQPSLYVIFSSSDTPTYGSAPTITYTFNTLADGTGTSYLSTDTSTVNASGTSLFKGNNTTTSETNVSLNSSANAGSYGSVFYLSGLSSPVYTLSAGTTAGSLSIDKANTYVMITAGQSSIYGATPTINYTYYNNAAGTGGAAITSPAGLTGAATIMDAPTAASDAGTYQLTYASGLSSTNYAFNSATSSVAYSVSPKPITITNNVSSTTYDAATSYATLVGNAGFTTNVSLVGSDAIGSVTQATTVSGNAVSGIAQADTFVSTPSAAVLSTGNLSNYTFTYMPTTNTVAKANLAITGTASSSGNIYNGNTYTSAYTTSFLGSDAASATITGMVSQTNAGTYTSALQVSGSVLSNYNTPVITDASYVISPKSITYTTAEATGTYGTLSILSTPSFVGVVGSDNVGATVTAYSGTTPVTISATTNSGSYTQEVSALSNTNYAIASTGNTVGNLVISPKTITYTTTSATGTYGTLSTLSTATFVGVVGSDNVGATVTAYSGTTPVTMSATTNAGSYTQEVSALSNGNYQIASTGNTIANLVISPLAITITGADHQLTYNHNAQTNSGATYTIGSGSATAITGSNVPTGVGSQGFTLSGYGSGTNASTTPYADSFVLTANNGTLVNNYSVTVANNGSGLTINKASLSLTGTQAYNGTATISGASLTVEGVSYLDNNNNLVNEAFTATGLADLTTKNVQTNQQLANINGLSITANGGASLDNYFSLSVANTSVSVTPLVITLTAPSITKTYDGGYTYNMTSNDLTTMSTQLVGGDRVTAASVVFTGNNPNVGTNKSVSLNSATISDGNSGANYTVTLAYSSTSEVTAASLTVTANNANKFVTQTDPTGYNGVVYSGWVNGEGTSVLGGSLSIARSTPTVNSAGTYTLTPAGLTANNSNYTISYQAGSFRIIPADQLLVEVTPVTTNYGTAPTYTATAQYLTCSVAGCPSSGSVNVIHSLSPVISGSAFSVSDGAGGSAAFTITPVSATNSSSGNINVGGYQLSAGTVTGTSANFSNTVALTGALTVSPLTLAASQLGVSGVTKVYNGSNAISGLNLNTSATNSTILSGDAVTVMGTGTYADANVGTNKAVTVAVGLTGADAGNYVLSNNQLTDNIGTITQLASVTYTGASGGNWSNASNWAGGAIPTLSNVATVIIPTATTVIYDTSNLTSLTPTSAITDNGTISFTAVSPTTFANNVSGTGSIAVSGLGTVTLTGNNTYSGGTTIASGSTLIAGSANALGSNAVTSSGGTFATSGGVILSSLTMNGAVTLGSDITSSGAQIYNGAVTLGQTLTLTALTSTITINNSVGKTVETYKSLDYYNASRYSNQSDSWYMDYNTYLANINRVAYRDYSVNRNSINAYNFIVSASRININADITTYGTQTYGSVSNNSAVYIGDNGTNGRIRSLVSEDPAVTFWGTVDDATANTHSLNVNAVCFSSCTGSDLPTIDFKSDVGQTAALYSLTATTGQQDTSVVPGLPLLLPEFTKTSENPANYVGVVSIMGDVTTQSDQTYTGRGVVLGDGTANQEQTFKTTGGNVTFNVGTSGLTASNNPMTVTFDLNGGTHSNFAGTGINYTDKGVTVTSTSSSEGLAGLIQVSSNRSAKDITAQTRTGKATVEVFDATVRCNDQAVKESKECS